MLQSEFYDRTKVQLDSEQYAKVEAVYNAVKMDKDEFCAEWKKLSKSKLMGEIEDSMRAREQEYGEKLNEIRELKKQLDEQRRYYEGVVLKGGQKWAETMMEFAQRIVRANEDGDLRVYDVVEEQYGIGFIIKTKHEAGIPLSEAEINYMVGKL